MAVILRIRNNLRPLIPVGKPNRPATTKSLAAPSPAGAGRHQSKAPNGGATYAAQGQAACGAAGRRHPGKTRKTDHPPPPVAGGGARGGGWDLHLNPQLITLNFFRNRRTRTRMSGLSRRLVAQKRSGGGNFSEGEPVAPRSDEGGWCGSREVNPPGGPISARRSEGRVLFA